MLRSINDLDGYPIGAVQDTGAQGSIPARCCRATASVDLTRQAIKDSPPYAHTTLLYRQQEAGLFEHYVRRSYWADDLILDRGAT